MTYYEYAARRAIMARNRINHIRWEMNNMIKSGNPVSVQLECRMFDATEDYLWWRNGNVEFQEKLKMYKKSLM